MREQLGGNSPDGSLAQGLAVEILAAGAAKILETADSFATVLLDTAAGSIVTLPEIHAEDVDNKIESNIGMKFYVVVSASVTSNSHVVQPANTSQFIIGGIQMMIDTTAVSEGQFADGATHLTITMNGSTTGGLIGTVLEFTAISATQWAITGLVAGSGTLATPFTT